MLFFLDIGLKSFFKLDKIDFSIFSIVLHLFLTIHEFNIFIKYFNYIFLILIYFITSLNLYINSNIYLKSKYPI